MVPRRSTLVDRLELELPGETALELVGYRIHPDSAVARGERVPRWARPVLIVREGRAYSVHNAKQLRPGDQAYLFASPRQAPVLDKVYASPVEPDDPDVFGDFGMVAETTMAELAHHYGAEAADVPPETSLGALLMKEFHDQPAAGDRMSLGPVEIVVRALKDDGSVAEVGVILEHPPKQKRRWPSWLRRLIPGRKLP
jgi:cell volume regulation protein A